MKLFMNYPNDKNMLEDRIAYIRATLMQKYIEDVNIKEEEKRKIRTTLKEELKTTCIIMHTKLE